MLAWTKALSSVLAALLVIAPPAAAQSPDQPPPLRVTTRMVQVSVIVQDEKGSPVTGLTRDEFQLFDNGKPQTISGFSTESVRVPPAIATAPREANVFSNRAEQPPDTSGSTTVILIDASNTRYMDLRYSRLQLEAFLRQLQPSDRVAIYCLGDGLTLLRDFTNDGTSLIQALDKLPKQASLQISGSQSGDPDIRLDYQTERAAETPLELTELANHLAGIPGRKNLIWLSGGFQVATGYLAAGNRRSFDGEIGRAARALNDANVAVYPVDARGLFTDGDGDLRFVNTMDLFAQFTGGMATYNTNDIGGAIRRAADDSRMTYNLGYYPDQSRWDGSFHDIKVRVDRRGIQMRYRRGYFAAQPSTSTDKKLRVQQMRAAAADPLEATAIGLKLEPISTTLGAAPHLKTRLTIDPRNVLLNPSDGRWTGAVDLYYVESDSNRHVLASLARTVALNLPPVAYDKVSKDGVKIMCDFPIKPGATEIRLVALDGNSGQIGTVTIPLSAFFPKSTAN